MPWIHRSNQVDGSWSKRFKTEAGALKSLAKFLGSETWDGEPLRSRRAYHDDFGGRHYIEEVAASVRSGRTDEAIGRAFDARECGTATKAQLALLARHHY